MRGLFRLLSLLLMLVGATTLVVVIGPYVMGPVGGALRWTGSVLKEVARYRASIDFRRVEDDQKVVSPQVRVAQPAEKPPVKEKVVQAPPTPEPTPSPEPVPEPASIWDLPENQ